MAYRAITMSTSGRTGGRCRRPSDWDVKSLQIYMVECSKHDGKDMGGIIIESTTLSELPSEMTCTTTFSPLFDETLILRGCEVFA